MESAYDFDVAVAAGVDVIAHMPGFWPDPIRVKGKGPVSTVLQKKPRYALPARATVVITTVGDAIRENTTPDVRAAFLDVLRSNFNVLKRHRVKIAIGSDEYGSTSVPEALAIARSGMMTSVEVLQALSVTTPAAIFPQRAPFGLAEGALANFIGFERDPLRDVESITRVSLRVKEGFELNLAR